jgi:hypothetical protein
LSQIYASSFLTSSSSVDKKGSDKEESSDNNNESDEKEEVKLSKKVNIKEEPVIKKEEVESVMISNVIKKEEVEPVMVTSSNITLKKEKPEPVNLVKELGLDDLMDDKSAKKMPSESIKKLDLGTVVLGGDGKTKYIVSLNKLGKKYWKKY